METLEKTQDRFTRARGSMLFIRKNIARIEAEDPPTPTTMLALDMLRKAEDRQRCLLERLCDDIDHLADLEHDMRREMESDSRETLDGGVDR